LGEERRNGTRYVPCICLVSKFSMEVVPQFQSVFQHHVSLPSLEHRVGSVASPLPASRIQFQLKKVQLISLVKVVSAPFDSIDDQTSFRYFFPGSWEGRSVRLPVLIGGARQKGNAYTFGTVGNARFLKLWSKKTSNGITSMLGAGDAIGVVWLGRICVTIQSKLVDGSKCGNGRGEIVDNGWCSDGCP
jgi:hypothetical protein